MPRPATPLPLYAAAFVLAVDTAGAGHLFPGLEQATRAPPHGGAWFLSVYMLGALLGAPLLARVAMRRGRTRVLATALAAFAVGSAIVGSSSVYALTLAGRFMQGFAGSPIMPLGAAHLGALSPSDRKGRALGFLSLSYSAGFLAGMAFVSLFLLLSFRVAYLFTSVLAALAAFAVSQLPEAPPSGGGASTPLPRLMAWLGVLGVGSFALNPGVIGSVSAANAGLLRTGVVLAAKALCVPALVWFVWFDRKQPAPLLPRGLFRHRLGVASAALAVAAGVGQASVVVLPACAMAGLGVSAAASGPLLGPIVIGGLSANLLASARLDSWGPAPFLGYGLGLTALGNVVTAFLGTHVAGFELGALLLGTGVSSMSSGALRYLATLYGTSNDVEANQAAVSLLTNVGVLLGGSVWGALVASAAAPVAVIRLGLVAMTIALVPPAAAIVLLPLKLPERKGAA